MMPDISDPRLFKPQCHTLAPAEELLHTPWFTIMNRGGYYTMESSGPQVIVLPVVEGDSVIMVKVKRPVIADAPLELPAGGVNENESPAGAASREMLEETGLLLAADRFKALPPLSGAPNRSPYLLHVFLVDVSEHEFMNRGQHDEEVEEVLRIGFDQAIRMILAGDIYISVPIAIISRYLFGAPSSLGKILAGCHILPDDRSRV